jgi:hypothetical protein
MARILTKTQEQHPTYPVITINFSQDGLQGPLRDLVAGVPFYQSMMTTHVLVQNSDGLAGPVIARGIMQDIITEISTWTTPITGGTQIFDAESDIKPMQNLGRLMESRSIYDYVLSVDLYHS